MTDENPSVQNSDQGQANRDVTSTGFKSTSAIIGDSVKAMNQLAPLYLKVGMGGILVIAGIVLAVLTIALSFATGAGNEGKWYGGITLAEEIVFMVSALLIVSLGVVLRIRADIVRASIHETNVALDREQNRWIHEETMADIEARLARSPKTNRGGGATKKPGDVIPD